jgi:acetolactate synthase regulatory subunit
MILRILSGVTPAWNSPLIATTGARPQAPMQATTSMLNLPSRVVWPGSILSVWLQRVEHGGRALHVAGRTAADLAVHLAERLKAELVVEGRHAVDLADRQLEALADGDHRIAREIALGILDPLQQRDQVLPPRVRKLFEDPGQFRLLDDH